MKQGHRTTYCTTGIKEFWAFVRNTQRGMPCMTGYINKIMYLLSMMKCINHNMRLFAVRRHNLLYDVLQQRFTVYRK